MTDHPDCARCRRIESAIERGLSRHAAREEEGWDECARDDCPMLSRPYRLKTCRSGGFSRTRREPVDQTRGAGPCADALCHQR
jgi:hypothetical protein